ncbi:hypothetical protein ACIBJE_19830 [Micromonospora sp. NPDC050187]|uniref:hypothetical protein n=1 Tax=Micromonospora sp. NPDC050187 TaxID=3364277 RepID=UPI003788ED7E
MDRDGGAAGGLQDDAQIARAATGAGTLPPTAVTAARSTSGWPHSHRGAAATSIPPSLSMTSVTVRLSFADEAGLLDCHWTAVR